MSCYLNKINLALKQVAKNIKNTKHSKFLTEIDLALKAGQTTKKLENYLKDGINFSKITAAYVEDSLSFDKEAEVKLEVWTECVSISANESEFYEVGEIEKFKKEIICFLKITQDRFSAIANSIFLNEIYSCLDSVLREYSESKDHSYLLRTSQIYRETLGISSTVSSKNAYAFFAGLRLTNRSQARMIKNLQDSSLKIDFIVTRLWKMLNDDSALVTELQVVNSSFGREDKVLGLETYTKINDEINKIKIMLSGIDDKEIAVAIRQILKGTLPQFIDGAFPKIKREQLLQAFSSITYLLFGCEVTRNPSMAVINQMLLDLIINRYVDVTGRQINWSTALPKKEDKEGTKKKITVRGFMPMAPSNATPVARQINSIYANFMPYTYKYPGSYETSPKKTEDPGKYIETPAELITLEANIVRVWLTYKGVDPNAISNEETIKAIKLAFTDWFGPVPEEKEEDEEDVTVTTNFRK